MNDTRATDTRATKAWSAADHMREAEQMLTYLGEHDDPRNDGYGRYAMAALAHAVLGLAIIHNGGRNPAAEEPHGF